MTLDYSYPNKPANERGWGPGWPNPEESKWVLIGYPSFADTARIRKEVHELLLLLLEETEQRGYKLDGPVTDDWAAVNRATKRSDGTYTTTPSNHSWGLAVDLNATRNVYGGGHDLPQWVADLWHDYGWRWLGPPIQDWQHFDFCGTPADAAAMTEKARKELGMTPEERETLKRAKFFLDAYLEELGKVEDPTEPAAPSTGGLRAARSVKKSEEGSAPAPVQKKHAHDVKVLGKTFTTTES